MNIQFSVSGLDNIFIELKNNIFNNNHTSFCPDLKEYLNNLKQNNDNPTKPSYEPLKNNTAQIISNEFARLYIDKEIDFSFVEIIKLNI